MHVIAAIKQHPYITAGGVFLVGLLLIRHGTGNAASPSVSGYNTQSAAEVAAGTQLQALQIQSQAQSNQVNAAASVANQQIAAQLEAVKINAQSSNYNADIQGHLAEMQATLAAQTTQAVSTLQAQVANNQTAAAIRQQEISAAEYTAINKQNTDAQIAIASMPYQLQALQITTQASANSQAIQDIYSKLTGVNTSITHLTDVSAQQNQWINNVENNVTGLRTETGQAVADLNAWSVRYMGGGAIAPGLFVGTSGKNTVGNEYQAGYTNH